MWRPFGIAVPAESPRRWRFGLLYYPLAMNFIFVHLKFAIPKLHPAKMDSFTQPY